MTHQVFGFQPSTISVLAKLLVLGNIFEGFSSIFGSEMQPSSSSRCRDYLTALSREIHKKLQRAEVASSQRPKLLEELFADIALEVDDRAKDIILSRGEHAIAPLPEGFEDHLCFYEVLSRHFVRVPEDGQPILDLIVKLWSQSFASHIFALLFYKWLFEVKVEDSEKLLRYSSALVQGSTNVFWIDIQTNTSQFQSLFHYLLVDVALNQSRLAILAVQLQKLKVEPVLLHYLSQVKILQGLELRMTTSTRLKTSPGGPMYTTRAVRHAAWDALDALFPVGQYPRHVISLFFQLLYPWYWPSSCWHFIFSCIKAILYSLTGLIVSSWEKLKRPKLS